MSQVKPKFNQYLSRVSATKNTGRKLQTEKDIYPQTDKKYEILYRKKEECTHIPLLPPPSPSPPTKLI